MPHKKYCTFYLIFLLYLLFSSNTLQAQDFMMQGWYWDYPKTSSGHKWADTLRLKAPALGQIGVNQIWIPPHVKASFGQSSNGYDPKDLYDLGEYGATGLGTRAEFDAMVSAFEQNNILTIGDMVYNHRDGGLPENNPSVEGWIKNYNSTANHPFPSDRARAILPIGGSTSRGTGEYYISFRSATGAATFNNKPYRLYLFTNRVGWQNQADATELEPNNGAGQFNTVTLGRNFDADIDASGGIDEYKITLSANDFNAAGDTLYIIYANRNGDYADHFIWNGNVSRNQGLWYDADGSGPNIGTDVMPQVRYQTYTNFMSLPSGQGGMTGANFKPNGNPTNLGGFPGDFGWDHMLFFYDYDQFVPDTRDKLFEWTKWNWENAGIRGLRVDAIKHFTPSFMGDLLDYLHDQGHDPPMVVGEWYGTNAAELTGWVQDVLNSMDEDTKAAIQPKIFDFLLRDALRQACDGFGYDTRNVFNENLRAQGLSGFNVVTFANNHDFRRNRAESSNFESLIKSNTDLAYAFLLTNNQLGIPCIFYPDYYGYRPAQFDYHPEGLPAYQKEINQLILAHKAFIFGANSVDYLNRFSTPYSSNYISGFPNTSLIYQLSGGTGGREVVVAINFAGERLRVDHQIRNIAQGTNFTDVMGRSAFPTAIVDNQNRIYMDLPPRSYSVWVQGEVAPLSPTTLKLVSVAEGEAALSWTDNSSNETGFVLERKTGQTGAWATINTLNKDIVSYQDNTIGNNTDYFYRVKASNAVGNSGYSNEVKARFNFDPTTSLEPSLGERIQVFPNPNSGRFLVRVQGFSGQGELQVTDTQGKVQTKGILQSTEQNLDLSHLPKGVYLLNITLNGQKHTQRIIIE